VSRNLIVNADDLGASVGVNEGIARCHRAGVLTSASLMVTGAAVAQAIELSAEHPALSVGLHWDVLGEDERDFDLGDEHAVREEFAEQLGRFRELIGREPTHVDSHRHTHLEPQVRELFAELVAPLGVPLRGDGRVFFIGGFYAQWEWEVTDLRHVSVEAFARIVHEEVGEGWTELSCHPGFVTPDYTPVYREEREEELRTLTDPRTRAVLEREGVLLRSYAELAREAPAPR
jgi:predicted glycoside hydrolase/deacetylase ChbG (UPF0249 family)